MVPYFNINIVMVHCVRYVVCLVTVTRTSSAFNLKWNIAKVARTMKGSDENRDTYSLHVFSFCSCMYFSISFSFYSIKKVKRKVFINLILLQYICFVGFIILCNGCVSSLTFIYILNQQLKIYVHWKQNKSLKALCTFRTTSIIVCDFIL